MAMSRFFRKAAMLGAITGAGALHVTQEEKNREKLLKKYPNAKIELEVYYIPGVGPCSTYIAKEADGRKFRV